MPNVGYTRVPETEEKTESQGFSDSYCCPLPSNRNNSQILDKRKIREKLVQKQTEQHENISLFKLVKKGKIDDLENYLKAELASERCDWDVRKVKMEGKIDNQRDCVGANIIHVAYLVKNYEIGRWLVKSFPELAIKPYETKFDEKVHKALGINKENSNEAFPYEGENILHIVIVQKNYEEAKWLLDFYCARDPKQLKELLLGKTTGHFFTDRKDSFYCGCFPLHFAACSNDMQLFDLILAYNSSLDCIKDDDDQHAHESPTGFDVVFMRDQDGNNCLHLVVIHKLKKMYDHILSTVKAWLLCDLKRKVYKSLPPPKDEKWSKPAWREGFGSGYTLLEENSENSEENNSEKNRLTDQDADRILCRRMTMVLNNDHLSPLTLCAAGLYADIGNSDETSASEQESRKDMLQFLINQMKSVQWVYGRNYRKMI